MIITKITLHTEDETEQKLYHLAYEKLSEHRKAKISRRKFEKDRIQMIAASILKNYTVGRYVEGQSIQSSEKIVYQETCQDAYALVQCEEISFLRALEQFDVQYEYPIVYGENGKPSFAGAGENIHFNVSHSQDCVVCMVHNKPVGIDVEGERQNAFPVAKRFFTASEYDWVCQKDGMHRFLQIWTLKEAYAKVTGIGIAKGLAEVSFQEQNEQLYFTQPEQNEEFGIVQYHTGKQVISGIWQK